MERVVPKDSPLSPSLFNLFIEPLAEKLREVASGEREASLNLFADNIALFAPTAQKMQQFLFTCESWATSSGLTWGINKCHKLVAVGTPETELTLNNETFQYVSSAQYLEVVLKASRISDAASLDRIRKTRDRLRMMRA